MNEKEIVQNVAQLRDIVMKQKPLIHCITNFVTVNDCANVVIATGASPIMANESREVEEITAMSQALLINTGTLTHKVLHSIVLAAKKANELGIPVILDPVGAGTSKFRCDAIDLILSKIKISIIRGNLSEISFIAGYESSIKGVDTSESDEIRNRADIAASVARSYECVVCVTGKNDFISDGFRVIKVHNGTPILTKITGTGCMTSAITASYASVAKNMMDAALAGVLTMSIAGENAAKNYVGLGTYHVNLIDEIGNMTKETLIERARIYETEN